MEQLTQAQVYLSSSYLCQKETPIISFVKAQVQEPKKQEVQEVLRVLLKDNIFHPQGGGQPNDEGNIQIGANQYPITTIFVDKESHNVYLEFRQNLPLLLEDLENVKNKGENVLQQVDENKRRLNARLHSAGHLLDIAVKKVGLQWQPAKGYHFPDGPYVEYIGSMEQLNADDIRKQIEDFCKVIQDQTVVEDKRSLQYLTPEQIGQKLGEIPEYLKKHNDIRYIELCKDDTGCPCGGTHVEHIKEIGIVTIRKVIKKGKNVRVTYDVKV